MPHDLTAGACHTPPDRSVPMPVPIFDDALLDDVYRRLYAASLPETLSRVQVALLALVETLRGDPADRLRFWLREIDGTLRPPPMNGTDLLVNAVMAIREAIPRAAAPAVSTTEQPYDRVPERIICGYIGPDSRLCLRSPRHSGSHSYGSMAPEHRPPSGHECCRFLLVSDRTGITHWCVQPAGHTFSHTAHRDAIIPRRVARQQTLTAELRCCALSPDRSESCGLAAGHSSPHAAGGLLWR